MATAKKFGWNRSETPVELHPLLETLSEDYPLSEGQSACKLVFRLHENSGRLEVAEKDDEITIDYDTASSAARGLGLAIAGRRGNEGTVFKTLGIMLDCSRNAVMTVEHFKAWLRQLSLMGYNMAMLYTEDTYQLPGEPYFGYMRGPYTMQEIKELDAYAKRLGIELIACIQVLGHMEQILQWPEYFPIKDARNVMLVDEPQTYELIEKMIDFWSRALSARRIHINMDETHDLGRGRFMDIHGYERGFDIFNRHLERVNEICRKYGLKTMIASDMYFRLGNAALDYYDTDTVIPNDVKEKIPADVDLVYWDYYHREREFYVEWIKRHRELGHEPLMASGVWTWSKLWCDHEITQATIRPCLEACRESKLAEVIFSLWGDDGAYCEFDSALAGLCWAAELAFGNDGGMKDVEKSFRAICGGNYAAHESASQLEYTLPDKTKISAASLLWDDPMLMKYQHEIVKLAPEIRASLHKHYHSLAEKLKPFEDEISGGDIGMARQAALLISNKIILQNNLSVTYLAHDLESLKKIAEDDIPAIIRDCRNFAAVFRKQWLRHNKRFGLDVIQVRLGGQIARWEEAAVTVMEFLNGTTLGIPELDAGKNIASAPAVLHGHWGRWALSSLSIWDYL